MKIVGAPGPSQLGTGDDKGMERITAGIGVLVTYSAVSVNTYWKPTIKRPHSLNVRW